MKSAVDWKVTGVENVPRFAAIASEYGEVFSTLEEVKGTFDAVSIMAVLEHVSSPLLMMREAYRLANPGALLVIAVPNGRRLDAWLMDRLLRASGRSWTVRTAPLQTPFHLAEFSKKSLRFAAETTGWDVQRIWAVRGHTPYPIPSFLRHLVTFVADIGSFFGYGLNLFMLARKTSNAAKPN